MPPLSLDNVLAYSVQVALVTVVGAALVALVRLRLPAARLSSWRVLLLLCVCLPLIQPWGEAPGAVSISAVAATASGADAIARGGPGGWPLPATWAQLVLAVWLAGCVIWLARLGLGLCRLRMLRRSGTAALLDAEVREVGELLNVDADVRWVARLRQPVTFGVRRPVVLLPEMLRELPTELLRAVMAHELLHVWRRDWVWVVAEEVVRAIFWYHPAIWWLLAQVQLAREQVVDEQAVAVLGARRSYMRALLACADRAPIAPVPAFARQRQLLVRLRNLSMEVSMSRARLVMSLVAVSAGVVIAGALAVGAFPLHGAPTVEGPAGQPESGGAGPALRPIVRVAPQLPEGVFTGAERAVVELRITVDEQGRVTHADVLSVAPEDRLSAADREQTAEAVRAAVLQWRYAPRGQRMAAVIALQVGRQADEGAADETTETGNEMQFVGNVELVLPDGTRLSGDKATYSEDSGVMFIEHATTGGVVRGVQAGTPAGVEGARGAGGTRAGGEAGVRAGASQGVRAGSAGSVLSTPPIRVGGPVAAPRQVSRVQPVYPQVAQAARVQGVVVIEVTVGTDGTVEEARVLKSIPLLDQAAVEAVRQWKYTPTVMNGEPVPVVMTVTVTFTLRD